VTAYLLEEAYELVSAIDAGDMAAIGEELGDLLFQVLFIAQLFEEQSDCDLAAVAERNRAKMMGRHPHVFGDETLASAGAVKKRWSEIKAAEKKAQGRSGQADDLPAKLPALLKACRYFDRLPQKPRPKETLDQAILALRAVAAALPEGDCASAETDPMAAQAAGDALLQVVHTIVRLNRHPEALLNQALERQLSTPP
jgi:uncharacterized protein YabN with tetrapyrrole methylase and pyrophosphatase domain